jgi:hypothetical protein
MNGNDEAKIFDCLFCAYLSSARVVDDDMAVVSEVKCLNADILGFSESCDTGLHSSLVASEH